MKRAAYLMVIFFLIISVLILFAAACNKSINSGSNKSYLSVTNLSPDAPPLDIYFDSSKINGSNSLPYDSTTGIPGNPYLTVIAGIHSLKLTAGSQILLDGNIALQVNKYYSLFVYDSANTKQLNTLIMQDALTTPPDTVSLVRFLNFTDTAFYISMTNQKDTFMSAYSHNIKANSMPASFTFTNVKPGAYQVRAIVDTATSYKLDSLSFSGSKIYSVYMLKPANLSISDSLKSGVVYHN